MYMVWANPCMSKRNRMVNNQRIPFFAETDLPLLIRVTNTYIQILAVYTVLLAGDPPNIRSYTVYIYKFLANHTNIL